MALIRVPLSLSDDDLMSRSVMDDPTPLQRLGRLAFGTSPSDRLMGGFGALRGRGPRVEIPQKLQEALGGGFRRSGRSLGKPRVLQAREAAGRADIPSAEYAASTEAPGGRAFVGAPPEGITSGGFYDLSGGAPAQKMLTRGPYANVPEQLMGFAKSGRYQKGFHEQNYPYELPIEVQIPGMEPFDDAQKGMNFLHAMARALRNWEGAGIIPKGKK